MKTIRSAAMLLTLAALLSGAGACKTPLDLDTPRIDSVLAATAKMKSMDMRVLSGNGSFDTTAIANWRYSQDTIYFSASRAGDPPTINLYTELFDAPLAGNRYIALEQLVVRLTNVPASGTIDLTEDPTTGRDGIYASVLVTIGGQPQRYTTHYFAPAQFTATATLNYTPGPVRTMNGEIKLILPANGNHRLTMTLKIAGDL